MVPLTSYKNASLQKSSAYVKDLYITMLCSILQHGHDLTQKQKSQLQQIMETIGHEDDLNRFIKRGLSLTTELLSEVKQHFSEPVPAMNLIIDALVLSNEEGKISAKAVEIIGEIIDIFNLSPREFSFLTAFAEMVIQGNFDNYHQFCHQKPNVFRAQMFSHYFPKRVLDLLNEIEYKECINRLLTYELDFAKIKETFATVTAFYRKHFEKAYLNDFKQIEKRIPLAIFVILMNEELRGYYLKEPQIKSRLMDIYKKNKNQFAPYVREHDQKLFDYITNRGGLMRTIVLEPEATKCLMVYMDEGKKLLTEGRFSVETGGLLGVMNYPEDSGLLKAKNINGEFPLLQGLLCETGYPKNVPSIIYFIDPTTVVEEK